MEVGGASYEIRSDYRAVLDICSALSDDELSDQDRALVALDIFYPGLENIPPEDYNEAIRKCFWFINCGDGEQNKKSPKLVDWELDFKFIVSPVNRVVGKEIRSLEYMHWWSFIAAYYEIGDCTFAQIVRIREKLAKGKALDKQDREWYRRNRDIVDLKKGYTAQDKAVMETWGV
jgi:hypothetical protein